MKIEKFEDLIAWQEARKLTNLIYDVAKKFDNKDLSLARQMRRAAVSVMSNISEGFGRHTFNDSKQFFTIARGSIAELQSHLYIAKDQGYFNDADFEKLYKQTISVNKLINGIIKNSKNQLANSRTYELANRLVA